MMVLEIQAGIMEREQPGNLRFQVVNPWELPERSAAPGVREGVTIWSRDGVFTARIAAAVRKQGMVIPVRMSVMRRSRYLGTGAENPLGADARPGEFTLALVVSDREKQAARDALGKELANCCGAMGAGLMEYLDIGMAIGAANRAVEPGSILLLHEGGDLSERHGRANMTVFTNRFLKRANRYGLARKGTAIIGRTGRKESERREYREYREYRGQPVLE